MIIEKVSNKIVKLLIDSELIDDTEEYRDYYQYGAEITVSSILNVVLVLLLGLIFHRFYSGIIYLLLSAFIKRFTGGYHADTYYACNAIGCIIFICIVLLSELTERYIKASIFLHLMVFISFLIVALMCPIENPNKPIKSEMILPYKYMSIAISLLYIAIGYIGRYICPFAGNLVLNIFISTALFAVIGKIKNGKEKLNGK